MRWQFKRYISFLLAVITLLVSFAACDARPAGTGIKGRFHGKYANVNDKQDVIEFIDSTQFYAHGYGLSKSGTYVIEGSRIIAIFEMFGIVSNMDLTIIDDDTLSYMYLTYKREPTFGEQAAKFFADVGAFFANIGSAIGDFFKKAAASIGNFFKNLATSVGGFFKSVFGGNGNTDSDINLEEQAYLHLLDDDDQIIEEYSIKISPYGGETTREMGTAIRFETNTDWRVCVEDKVNWIETFWSKTVDGRRVVGTGKEVMGGPGTYEVTFRYAPIAENSVNYTNISIYYNIPEKNNPDVIIVPVSQPIYRANVNTFYDNGYTVRYGQTDKETIATLNRYVSNVSKRYEELLGLTLIHNGATYYPSILDVCKGTVVKGNIDTECSHSNKDNKRHDNQDNICKDVRAKNPGNKTTTTAFWTGHRTVWKFQDREQEYRSYSSGTIIFLTNDPPERMKEQNRDLVSTGVLMHELNHQYGGIDHYHDVNARGDCLRPKICSEPDCGSKENGLPEGRDGRCIMNKSRQNIKSLYIICSDCKKEIISHLNKHHRIK